MIRRSNLANWDMLGVRADAYKQGLHLIGGAMGVRTVIFSTAASWLGKIARAVTAVSIRLEPSPDPLLFSHRLHLVGQDMLEAHMYLLSHQRVMLDQFQRENPGHFGALADAALGMAIVVYSRGFLSSRTDGRAARLIKFRDLDLNAQEWARRLHKTLVKRRNQMIAHSDWSEHNTKLSERQHPLGVGRQSSAPDLQSGIDIGQFIELVLAVHREVSQKDYEINMARRAKYPVAEER